MSFQLLSVTYHKGRIKHRKGKKMKIKNKLKCLIKSLVPGVGVTINTWKWASKAGLAKLGSPAAAYACPQMGILRSILFRLLGGRNHNVYIDLAEFTNWGITSEEVLSMFAAHECGHMVKGHLQKYVSAFNGKNSIELRNTRDEIEADLTAAGWIKPREETLAEVYVFLKYYSAEEYQDEVKARVAAMKAYRRKFLK